MLPYRGTICVVYPSDIAARQRHKLPDMIFKHPIWADPEIFLSGKAGMLSGKHRLMSLSQTFNPFFVRFRGQMELRTSRVVPAQTDIPW